MHMARCVVEALLKDSHSERISFAIYFSSFPYYTDIMFAWLLYVHSQHRIK